MLASRMKQLSSSMKETDVLFDRGVADTLIFADTNYELGKIDERDYQVYEEYFNVCVLPTIFDQQVRMYDLMIYLKVSDQTSLDHIHQRGLDAEQKVDPEY
jgi:deoxyadenosine/deoxycytidine kinase